jgi:hypothetical protein
VGESGGSDGPCRSPDVGPDGEIELVLARCGLNEIEHQSGGETAGLGEIQVWEDIASVIASFKPDHDPLVEGRDWKRYLSRLRPLQQRQSRREYACESELGSRCLRYGDVQKDPVSDNLLANPFDAFHAPGNEPIESGYYVDR